MCLLLAACNSNREPDTISLVWEGTKATAVVVPWKMITGGKNVTTADMHIRLEYRETDILGEWKKDSGLVFEPLIPFTNGETYRIFYRHTGIGIFSVPKPDSALTPEITHIYPQTDTVPSNLLKLYLRFSQPMQENVSAGYIRLIRGTDTVPQPFLDLSPELWNEDRTVLTLWFDPGRIKRDLQPNLKMGAPLIGHVSYRLVVLPGWKSAAGLITRNGFEKTLVTAQRDSLSPIVSQWTINRPAPGSITPLAIALHEPLDHYLLQESIAITGAAGEPLAGEWYTSAKDDSVYFRPAAAWQKGTYTLSVKARLEDLAGNNLNRPFDRDTRAQNALKETAVHTRQFQVP